MNSCTFCYMLDQGKTFNHCTSYCSALTNPLCLSHKRMLCGTTWACTSALCAWRGQRALYGLWMRPSSKRGRDRSLPGMPRFSTTKQRPQFTVLTNFISKSQVNALSTANFGDKLTRLHKLQKNTYLVLIYINRYFLDWFKFKVLIAVLWNTFTKVAAWVACPVTGLFLCVNGPKGKMSCISVCRSKAKTPCVCCISRDPDMMWFAPSFLCPQESRISGLTGRPGAEQHRVHSQSAGVQ